MLALPSLTALAQRKPGLGKYLVTFDDKSGSSYSTDRPWEFLSPRALERRWRAGIVVDSTDLPVSRHYLDQLKNAGARIHHTSRWLNAATVVADSATAVRLAAIGGVGRVQYLGRHILPKNPPNRPPRRRSPLGDYPRAGNGSEALGFAGLQNSLLNQPFLYYAGYRGRGIWVGVLDGGFSQTDTLSLFDSLALHHRLFEGWDFVEGDRGVYEGAQHGTAVLSVMGGNLPGYFVGMAPEATYFLLKTEDTAGEYPVEEANWIAGAEWADSVGIDIINASLGYTVFNDTTLNHRFADLDGRSSIGARGAGMAVKKGMIVCNSAGNSGEEAWKYVGVPADAWGVVAVGAIRADGARAAFSSIGPTADGRIKPDLMAPGEEVVAAGGSGVQLTLANGTSMASPMLAGGLAALWSAFPQLPALDILEAVFRHASRLELPDNELGYGVPNLARSWLDLRGYGRQGYVGNGRSGFFANPVSDILQVLHFEPLPAEIIRVELWSITGERQTIPASEIRQSTIEEIEMRLAARRPAGSYTLRFVHAEGAVVERVALW